MWTFSQSLIFNVQKVHMWTFSLSFAKKFTWKSWFLVRIQVSAVYTASNRILTKAKINVLEFNYFPGYVNFFAKSDFQCSQSSHVNFFAKDNENVQKVHIWTFSLSLQHRYHGYLCEIAPKVFSILHFEEHSVRKVHLDQTRRIVPKPDPTFFVANENLQTN